MIAIDLDGTLLDYNYLLLGEQAINLPIVRSISRRNEPVAIVTNQGGLPFGVRGRCRQDGRPYPTPDDFAFRLSRAIHALVNHGVLVAAVRVCVYHPKAGDVSIDLAARLVRPHLARLVSNGYIRDGRKVWRVYTTGAARKPSPLMLRSVGATEYWGDSPEDAVCAAALGVPFVAVERFVR